MRLDATSPSTMSTSPHTVAARQVQELLLAGTSIGGARPKAVVEDAEKDKPSTGIVVYTALLWALGLLDQLALD